MLPILQPTPTNLNQAITLYLAGLNAFLSCGKLTPANANICLISLLRLTILLYHPLALPTLFTLMTIRPWLSRPPR